MSRVPLPEPDTTHWAQWAGEQIKYHSLDQVVAYGNARAAEALRSVGLEPFGYASDDGLFTPVLRGLPGGPPRTWTPVFVPVPLRRARKVGGSYEADGWIVGEFLTLDSERRYVFEFEQLRGMLHIFGPKQLEIEP